MRMRVFSKRHPDAEVSFQQRIWYALIDHDPFLVPGGFSKNKNREPLLDFNNTINTIFEDTNLPRCLVDGRILKMDSQWLENEIHAKAQELLSIHGFEGTLLEFLDARSALVLKNAEAAMRQANLALERTVKGILDIDIARPGKLFRQMIDSGIIPNYYEGFLGAFEKILMSVPTARNYEKGVGHGQGVEVNQPPIGLAELAVNLTGVLILYLLKQYAERVPKNETSTPVEDHDFFNEEDIPF